MNEDHEPAAVDGFTWREIRAMLTRGIATAVCAQCGHHYDVEPDARDYNCHEGCDALATVTSPLVKLGLI